MEKTKTQQLLHETAEEIRRSTAAKAEVWQAIPFWTLESEGRNGWGDNWGLPYKYGMLGVDPGWPHRVFVECATGRLVVHDNNELVEASDAQIIVAYSTSPSGFDADWQLSQRKQVATDGKDIHNKELNDQKRDRLRERHKTPRLWTTPAEPIRYNY